MSATGRCRPQLAHVQAPRDAQVEQPRVTALPGVGGECHQAIPRSADTIAVADFAVAQDQRVEGLYLARAHALAQVIAPAQGELPTRLLV